MRPFLAGLLAASLLGCSTHRPAPDAQAAVPGPVPELQLPRDAVPTAYRLEMTLVPDRLQFEGRVEIDVAVARPLAEFYLHARDLEISSASVLAGGAEIPATLAQVTPDGVARLKPARPVPAGPATLRITWSGRWNTNLAGLYRIDRPEARYAYTQFEPVDARRAFPCFDEPAFKTPFEIALLVEAKDRALSNSPEASVEPIGELKRVRFERTPPIPTYLVFLGAGPFDEVAHAPIPANEVRARPLPLRGFAPRGEGGKLGLLLDLHAELLPILERWFGIPFPYAKLDAVAVPETPVAMENVGLITYPAGSAYFEAGRSPETLRGRLALLVAHEVSHQWFGDLVTPAWWDDLWLKESLASWLEERTVRSWRPALGTEAQRVLDADWVMRMDGLAATSKVRQPLVRLAEVDSLYNGMTYTKGASVLEAFARLMGEDRFRAGLRGYLSARPHGTGTAADFTAALSAAAGRDLSGPLGSFLDRPGIPLVRVRQVCDAAGARLELAQTRWLPLGSRADPAGTWGIPFCVRFEAGGRRGEACTLLDQPSGTLPLPACPTWVLPNADGAGYYRWSLDAAGTERLLSAGLPHLTPAERISTAMTLEAAARAGEVPYDRAISASLRFVGDRDEGVAVAPLGFLSSALAVVPPAGRAALGRRLGEALRPRFVGLGWEVPAGDPAPRRELREQLANFLALQARDEATRAEAARRGRAYAAIERTQFDDSAIDAGLAATALAVAVQEGDDRFFRALEARLATLSDPELRSRVTFALGSATAPATSAAALALFTSATLAEQERMSLLWSQLRQPETEPAAWGLVKGRLDALVASTSGFLVPIFPWTGTKRCEAERVAELRATFEPRLQRWPSMRQTLDEASESVALCASLRTAQGAVLAGWAAGH
jgi:alanyl aminopeptidase